MDDYARIATYYDLLLNPFLDSVRQRVVEQCGRFGAGRLLDICCGTARQAGFCFASGMSYAGADVSEAMLGAARRAYAGSAFQPSLVRADGTQLPFADGCFDIALIAFALHEKPLTMAEGIVREAQRVARHCILVDYTLAERNLELPFQWLMQVPERMVGGEHWRCYREFMRAGALQGLMHRLGLSVIERTRLFGGGAGIYVCGQA